MPVESISEIEIVKLYGKDSLDEARLFMTDGAIATPFAYKAFVEMLLWNVMNDSQKSRYNQVIEIYTSDVRERFNSFIDVMGHLGTFGKFGIMSAKFTDLSIRNLYKWNFNETNAGLEFERERDLESLLYDIFYWFDLNEGIEVKRQYHTSSGPVDLFIKHSGNSFATELKRGKAKRKDVYQTADYVKGIASESKAILIASSFEQNEIDLAKELQVGCYKYVIVMDLPDTMIILEPIVANEKFSAMYNFMVEETGDMIGRFPKLSNSFADKYHEVLEWQNASVRWFLDEVDSFKAKDA